MRTDELELLTMAELAEAWQLSERTVRRRVKSGEIPSVRFGRTVRIRAEVARAISRGETPANVVAHSIDRRSAP
jgi:excisionase family DNA binding protein